MILGSVLGLSFHQTLLGVILQRRLTMKKYRVNEDWEVEEYEDTSDIFVLIVEQTEPNCSFVYRADFDPEVLRGHYGQLVSQYQDSESSGLTKIHLIKVPNTNQVCAQIKCANGEQCGTSIEALEAVQHLLTRADCDFIESWKKSPLSEAKRKKRKKFDNVSYTTGCPALNMDFFNSRFGTGNIGDHKCEDSDCFVDHGEAADGAATDVGGESGGSLGEAFGERGRVPGKRYIKRYFIRPQNIFCSKKEDILKALVSDVGENNCSVYSLKSLGDHDDVHLLQPSDIIYYYDDGILYDKNHVKVMDYDLNVKHEEERKKFADVDAISDEKFDAEYEDRLTESLDNICCICGEEIDGHGNNPSPVKEEGRCCDACNAKFVIPARIEAVVNNYEKN